MIATSLLLRGDAPAGRNPRVGRGCESGLLDRANESVLQVESGISKMRDQEVWLDNFESYIPKKAAAGTPSRGEHRHVMFCIREINHVLVVFDFSPG